MSIRESLVAFIDEVDGATAVEYALIVGLIGLVAALVGEQMGAAMAGIFTKLVTLFATFK